jgi:hypothetical protein
MKIAAALKPVSILRKIRVPFPSSLSAKYPIKPAYAVIAATVPTPKNNK